MLHKFIGERRFVHAPCFTEYGPLGPVIVARLNGILPISVQGLTWKGQIMRTFDELMDLAAEFHGDRETVEGLLPSASTADEVRKLSDDRILSQMARSIFHTGISWKVVENKWPGIEEAFEGFDPVRWKFMSDDDFDSLIKDTRIIRNGAKILSVRDNAIFLCDLAEEHGTAANFFADWPREDLVTLLEIMKKRGSRLGGSTGAYVLRIIGKDSWVLSKDVVQALIREGVIDKAPTSKTAMRAVQAAFNHWAEESGRPFAHISRTLAYSVGPNMP